MQVETARFGVLEVDEAGLYTFPMGLLGFARHKRFVIVDHTENSPFKWLQSTEDPELAFIISDPLFFRRDYHISVRPSELTVIEADREEDLVVSVIMTVPENPRDMTANLLAPLIFNVANRKAMQHVLTDHRYPVKFFVLRHSPAQEPETDEHTPLRSISLR